MGRKMETKKRRRREGEEKEGRCRAFKPPRNTNIIFSELVLGLEINDDSLKRVT